MTLLAAAEYPYPSIFNQFIALQAYRPVQRVVVKPVYRLAEKAMGQRTIAIKNLPKSFYQFQLSSLFSQLSFRCLQLAMAWLILDKSADATTYALVISISTAIEIGSRVVFAWLGDRYDKLAVFRYGTVVNLFALVILSALLFAGVYHILIIAGFIGVIGVTLGIRSPIETSAISQLVQTDQISKAVQVKNVVYSLANVIGPGLAGLLIALDGTSSALMTACALIVLSVLLLANLTTATSNNKPANQDGGAPQSDPDPWWVETFQGIRLVYVVKAELFLAIVAMLINICLFPFFTILIPVLVKETLQLDAWYIGLLDGSFSIGIMLGSVFLVEYTRGKVGRMHSVALGIALLALAMVACATITNLLLVAPIMVAGGIGLMLFNINASVPRLIATPEAFQNRMVAAVGFFSSIINPVGAYFSGALVDSIGIHLTLMVFSAVTFAAAGLVYVSVELTNVLRLPDTKLPGLYANRYPTAFESRS